ncbi:hypothetical protein F3Y22_tig00013285pilonHSYRG00299 [Hibiscus syriacus]|uniref:Uncharacterized protein n=1 Tax=Hibiscus syriacus TaxID=106335 RepID=A0A6A3C2G3_HIBSY|nr:hypothetical protein F3Y22_tig00013285pilonHSYRG00299 [Hibiscus syriacus]
MDVSMKLYIGVFLLQIFFSPLSTSCEMLISRQSFDNLSVFPSDFLFGTASSAYQYEGGYLSDGKGLNNWDVYSHKPGNKIIDGSNGDIAVDHYHRYLEDIDLMHSLGVKSYRFSISWARILPKGRFGEINEAGIEFYDNLIETLLVKGGSIGIVLQCSWYEPISDSTGDDKLAAERALPFTINWRFLEPIIFGRYPPEMQNILGSILPDFNNREAEVGRRNLEDGRIWAKAHRKMASLWESLVRWFGRMFILKDWRRFNDLKEKYPNIPMIITENEYMPHTWMHWQQQSGKEQREGYFAWSLLDNFEWNNGYTVQFGLHHVDYKTLTRTPKYQNLVQKFLAEHSNVKYHQQANDANNSLFLK